MAASPGLLKSLYIYISLSNQKKMTVINQYKKINKSLNKGIHHKNNYYSEEIMIQTITERLDRIEKKIDNRLNKTWLSISDVIQYTGYSRSTINRYISNGELKSVKNYGKRMFRIEWIERWLNG